MTASTPLPGDQATQDRAIQDQVIQDQAVLRVVAGDATEEEVAALVTALAAAASLRAAPPPPAPATRWADPAALLRAPLGPGTGAWQAAAWRR